MAASAELFCLPCTKDGFDNPAVDWCTDCCSLLCENCGRHHQRSQASKNHQTIPAKDFQELPGFMKNTENQCQKHDKRLEMYCISHECPCCIQCISDDHQRCSDLKKVSDVLSIAKSADCIPILNNKLEILRQNYDNILVHLKQERSSVNDQKAKKIKEMKDIRKQIDLDLDKLEEKFENEIESVSQESIELLNKTTATFQSKQKMAYKMLNDTEKMLHYASDLQMLIGIFAMNKEIINESEFLTHLQKGNELEKIKIQTSIPKKFTDILNLTSDRPFSFYGYYDQPRIYKSKQKSIEIKDLDCVELSVSMQHLLINNVKPILLRTHDVSIKGVPISITGCEILPNGEFFIVNERQGCVQHFDTQGCLKTRSLECTEDYSQCPMDICCINNNTCAVSIKCFPSKQDQFITIIDIERKKLKNRITVENRISCLYFQSFLLVGRDLCTTNFCSENRGKKEFGSRDSFSGKKGKRAGKIEKRKRGEILSYTLDGEIINGFKTNRIGGLFSSNSMIYYTEIDEDAVVCSNEVGEVIWRCDDPIIIKPTGIVVDNRGFIFVSCSNYIVLIYPNGKQCKLVLAQNDDINLPHAIAIDCRNEKLMVCNKQDGKVFLYQL